MQDLNAMAIFVQVVQAGGFSAAARQLAMPVSTVSRKVATLEAQLKVKLLERSTRRIRLTEMGALYFDQCRRGLDAFDAARNLVAERQAEVAGHLRISIPPNLAEPLFVPIVGAFQRQYPKASVAVLVTERNLDLIDDRVDLTFRVGPLRDSSLVVRKLATFHHVLAAAPSYLEAYGEPRHLDDLLRHRLIAFGSWDDREKRWAFLKGHRQETLTFEPVLSFNDYGAVCRAAASGQGIAEMPSIVAAQDLKAGRLKPLLSDWRLPVIDFQAIHSGSRNMSRLMRCFLEMCSTFMRGYEDVLPRVEVSG